MNYLENISRSSWLFKYKNINDVVNYNGVKLIHEYSESKMYQLTRTYVLEAVSIDDIKNALDKGDNEKVIEMLNQMKEHPLEEEYCQFIVYERAGLICLLSDKINKWTDFVNECNLTKVSYTESNIIESLITIKVTENILNVTYDFKKSDSMINAINIYGSNIQNSTEFENVLKDMESQIVSLTFESNKFGFLVTLSKNKLRVSKYAKYMDYLEFLNLFILAIWDKVAYDED